jgi:hypothetical protein
MKSFWCIFVMISVLFMSVDGAADLASSGHPHGGDSGHFIDEGTAVSKDTTAKSDPDIDHCEHCCHGHTSSITVSVTILMPTVVANDQRSCRAPHVGGLAQAPPTPPPNA